MIVIKERLNAAKLLVHAYCRYFRNPGGQG